MSKSLKRVRAALEGFGVDSLVQEMPAETRTARQAADAAGCALDQIAKSIIFQGLDSGQVVLFLTAGGNQVDTAKASAAAKEPLGKADAALIRARTGFAIGGVSPVGHLTPSPTFFDPRLLAFATVWAAAGTPKHIFPIDPTVLLRLTGAVEADFTV